MKTRGIHLILDQRALVHQIDDRKQDLGYGVADMSDASEEDLVGAVSGAAEAILHGLGGSRYTAYCASVACERWSEPVDVFEEFHTRHHTSNTWADYLAVALPADYGITSEQMIVLGEMPFGPEHQRQITAWRRAARMALEGGAPEIEAIGLLDAALALREGRVPGSRAISNFDPDLDDVIYDARRYSERWTTDKVSGPGHLVIVEVFLYWF